MHQCLQRRPEEQKSEKASGSEVAPMPLTVEKDENALDDEDDGQPVNAYAKQQAHHVHPPGGDGAPLTAE